MMDWDLVAYNLELGSMSLSDYPQAIQDAINSLNSRNENDHILAIRGFKVKSKRGNFIKDSSVDYIDTPHLVHSNYTSKQIRIVLVCSKNSLSSDGSYSLVHKLTKTWNASLSSSTCVSDYAAKYRIRDLQRLFKDPNRRDRGRKYEMALVQQQLKREWADDLTYQHYEKVKPLKFGVRSLDTVVKEMEKGVLHSCLYPHDSIVLYSGVLRVLIGCTVILNKLISNDLEKLIEMRPLEAVAHLTKLNALSAFIAHKTLAPFNCDSGIHVHYTFSSLVARYLRMNVRPTLKEKLPKDTSTTFLLEDNSWCRRSLEAIWSLVQDNLEDKIDPVRIDFWNKLFNTPIGENLTAEEFGFSMVLVPVPFTTGIKGRFSTLCELTKFLMPHFLNRLTSDSTLLDIQGIRALSFVTSELDIFDTQNKQIHKGQSVLPLIDRLDIRMRDNPTPQLLKNDSGGMVAILSNLDRHASDWKFKAELPLEKVLWEEMAIASDAVDSYGLIQWQLFEKIVSLTNKTRKESKPLDEFLTSLEELTKDKDILGKFEALDAKRELENFHMSIYTEEVEY
jgi:hypothetical protein